MSTSEVEELSPEDRQALVEEQEQAQLDDGQLKLNPYNDVEVAHQRWLETGQTEPQSLIPEVDGDGGDVFEDYREGKFGSEMEKVAEGQNKPEEDKSE